MPAISKNSKSVRVGIPDPEAAPAQERPGVEIRFHTVLYGGTILMSAFLLFQVELIMGKFVLPRFGGGPSVWSTCLLVFQTLLLAGYGYAAFISARVSAKLQAVVHVSLLAASGLLMALAAIYFHPPIFLALSTSYSPPENSPVWQITLLLLGSVGIQCVLLSASSPLLQHWFSRGGESSPYRLYALSNLGSMLGLLSYPFLVERWLALSSQAWVWTAAYCVFLFLAGACALTSRGSGDKRPEPHGRKPLKMRKLKSPATTQPKSLWLGLAACSCTMLLATTNLICQQVAPIPLLWVLPLSIYLLSFVICFDHARWYRREIFQPLYVICALLALKVMPDFQQLSVIRLLVIYSAALWTVCMVCHGELARLKPPPQQLTSFYLMVSAGGAVGSAFVVLLAPHIFVRFWEFQIALVGCAFLLIASIVHDKSSWIYARRYGPVTLVAFSLLMAAGALYFTHQLVDFEDWDGDTNIVQARTRNFFGVKTVWREEGRMELLNGHTSHGEQNTSLESRNEPTSYYARGTGIGLLLDNFPRSSSASLRVGVVGMGVGTLAAYGQTGDYFRFYEIDPAVPEFSQGPNPIFTFVQSSAAHVDVVVGDARLKMQQEVSRHEFQNFDVLVVDAFSGDSIPVHLLTSEALDLYLRQLRSAKSVIAFHISNLSLDLQPVVEGLARSHHLASVEIDTPQFYATWILLSQDPNALDLPALAAIAHPLQSNKTMRLWTDNYSSLFESIRW